MKTIETVRGKTQDEVLVSGVTGFFDREIADFAGYNESYFGYYISFWVNGEATVSLYKD